MSDKIALKRSLSLPILVLYGLGTTIGAGVYALVGEIASIAGYFAPISFLVASILASFEEYHLPNYLVVLLGLPVPHYTSNKVFLLSIFRQL